MLTLLLHITAVEAPVTLLTKSHHPSSGPDRVFHTALACDTHTCRCQNGDGRDTSGDSECTTRTVLARIELLVQSI